MEKKKMNKIENKRESNGRERDLIFIVDYKHMCDCVVGLLKRERKKEARKYFFSRQENERGGKVKKLGF